MDALFEFVRANPWPAVAAAITLAAMVLSQFIGNGGDGSFPDFGGD